MSVTDVVARLRQAHALLTEARHATTQADAAITDGATLFANATAGSTQPEVGHINHLATASSTEVRAANALFAQAQDLIDAYCHDIAGHGIGDHGNTSSTSPRNGPSAHVEAQATPSLNTATEDPETSYAGWIAELRRTGTKISPERIIRMARHRDGHLVWLEEGTEGSSGLAHILRPKRQNDFEETGTPAKQVADLIISAIERGSLAGYCGKDAEVYDVDFGGKKRRVAIVISKNGYIVTSYPMNLEDRVRPNKRRA
ncbi:hypothetical protein [Actinoalloteichus fjordicus]|uniref:Bacterial EndoU nuclease domain-containing protein n=1 Tax=Actinoalloteichus fjordicus TaxID=1612552 RepID=A0AAC9LAL0_9PSEU|nr:hypothetical protein [Actinoalloteichus fjordicus]APU13380.1 hypothetical protein UA74_06535 [Actinoalloteichus fjordicus]